MEIIPEFEYDRDKSKANRAKHGIDFEMAKALWRDDGRVNRPSRYLGEARHVTIGMIDGKIWTAIFTVRAGRIRLISARRARSEERRVYNAARD